MFKVVCVFLKLLDSNVLLYFIFLKLNNVSESTNVDFPLLVLQSIWLSVWFLVLLTSSAPRSAWKTRCKIWCLKGFFEGSLFCFTISLCVFFIFIFIVLFSSQPGHQICLGSLVQVLLQFRAP